MKNERRGKNKRSANKGRGRKRRAGAGESMGKTATVLWATASQRGGTIRNADSPMMTADDSFATAFSLHPQVSGSVNLTGPLFYGFIYNRLTDRFLYVQNEPHFTRRRPPKMGELIPLFSKTDVRFELTAVQRIRYENLNEVLRLRKRKDVPVVIINFILGYFQKKHEGWTLVMVWGNRVAEVILEASCDAPVRPGWLKLALMIIVIVFERFARGLRRLAGLGSTRSPGSELRLLESKEYKIRCTRRVFQAIHRIQERAVEAGSPITVDQMMVQGASFLEFYANERRKHPVKLIFQNKARDKGLEWLWDDYLNKFR